MKNAIDIKPLTDIEYVNTLIDKIVYVDGYRDLAMDGVLKPIILNKTPLKLIKITRAGMAYLFDEAKNKHYSVPPRNIAEFE